VRCLELVAEMLAQEPLARENRGSGQPTTASSAADSNWER